MGGRRCFDGVNDYVSMGDPTLTKLNGDVSVAAWVYPKSTSQLAIAAHTSGATAYWGFSFGTNRKLSFWNSAAGPTVTSPAALSLNQWYHFAGIRSAAGVEIFINGVSVATAAGTTGNGTTGTELVIGRFGSYSGYYSSSSIAETRIYNRALSANEIRLLAQRPGIAYELAPRKFYSLPAAAASSRQYRLFRPAILRGA
jgi:hypothetical protein